MSTPAFRERQLDLLSPHGFSRLHYYEWGDPDNGDVVICVHGLTRNGRDFDALATDLARDFRVIVRTCRGGKRTAARSNDSQPLPPSASLIARADSLRWVRLDGACAQRVLAARQVRH
jgi:hypothetical protein